MKYFKTFVNHLKAHQTIKCKICHQEVQNSKIQIEKHKAKFHSGETKLFLCPKCPKSFSLKSNLENHQKWHENPNFFECQHCQKRFAPSQHNLLLNHMKLHEPESEKFQCNEVGCLYVTGSKIKLDRHKFDHARKEKSMELKKTWIKCKFCPQFLKNRLVRFCYNFATIFFFNFAIKFFFFQFCYKKFFLPILL